MIGFLISLASATAQDTQPLEVVPTPPSTEQISATSWSCNLMDIDGNTIILEGRIHEIPAGWDYKDRLASTVSGIGPDFMTGEQQFEVSKPTSHTRWFAFSANGPGEVEYFFRFLFVNDELSLATINRYTPPTKDEYGRITAFANGSCSSKFHEIGETAEAL